MNTTSVTTDSLLAQLNWRYATKKFDPARKIDDSIWTDIEKSLVLTPSSAGLQPWKFLVVKNPKLREELVAKSWGQRQVADASHLVVLAAKKEVNAADVDRHIERTASVRGVSVESLNDFKGMVTGFMSNPEMDVPTWASKQVYIALGQLMTSVAIVGLDACPMEGIDPAAYDEILGLGESGYSTVVACPVGYRADDDKYASTPKVRFADNEIIMHIE